MTDRVTYFLRSIAQRTYAELQAVLTTSKAELGSRCIQKELPENDVHHNVKTIAASMRHQNLTPKVTRKLKSTTDSKHKMTIAMSLKTQEFNTVNKIRSMQVALPMSLQAKVSSTWQ
ncbi:hypothetical protein BBM40_22685 [Vibrio parahaemolyticus]|uniref:hypothetical protein n=1 Tax=Vibrio parahaemolyticus TaxID=670 RepID=UPI0004D4769B|nr:hypothetical protein [Vibrio parahaemolyticus]EJG0952363.1 hypothetical protein [Vibrio parahaemolyticus O1:K58]EGQ8146448.1 hypothetical protein [Vibrio parahaemolyticus]EGQ8249178.1 hypothetical protein [Vibrio parahaemolyticus]EGQ8340211.1 hypothetical protein [Vibrio parahaemolyticus]EGQ8372969.1 hypothetical protein [Vibrio parahaemolyticus]